MSNTTKRSVVAMMMIAGGLATAVPVAASAATANMKCGAKPMHHKVVHKHAKKVKHTKSMAKCGAKSGTMSGKGKM